MALARFLLLLPLKWYLYSEKKGGKQTMNWKFWERKTDAGKPSGAKVQKLSKPKNIPEPVGRYLVVKLGKNPDWVWNLKGAVRPRPEGKDRYDVRIFDLAKVAQKSVTVKDYTSLDEHPELILYEGWFDKKTLKVEIEDKQVSQKPATA